MYGTDTEITNAIKCHLAITLVISLTI